MTRLPRCAGNVLLISLFAACAGEEPGASHRVEVDTVNGVVQIRNSGPGVWGGAARWTVGSEPRLEIGTVAGSEEYLFGSVASVLVVPDGRIYVADSQVPEVRVFDRDGRFQFRIGGRGEGPGEFLHIDAMQLSPAEELLVRDPQQLRLSVFDPAGNFLRSFRLERPYLQFDNRTSFWVDDQGRIYDRVHLGVDPSIERIGIISYSDAGAVRDTAVAAAVELSRIMISQNDVPRLSFPVPFTPYPSVAVDRRGRILAGLGGAYRIAILDAGGDTTGLVTADIEPDPLPPWVDDSLGIWIQTRREQAGGGEVSEYSLPDHQPAYSDLIVDATGHWWAAHGGQRTTLATEHGIFNPEGVFLGTVATPRIRIYQIGEDFIAGRREDDLGVSYAVVYPLDRGGS
ncbi:MAG: 6-bladed beta-propeller [Gemmatimonadetes bacterium]|uniref:6-bladed beta-propeller n=1 Tax=Candidatus Kutchimonas denitrificans TaxID=3056748 RepID=A0AAE4Z4M0_9BACT|nr:6-bladed beta-propeller [Gemmatimonadota bacterium]NIR73674.1 6-bladed beta-propeller [Candidatus Kutchimonas denitrificans]NIS00724.1 6-bladed beta-propeller [Gemmatimonadota bacterium]NIT66311.1 6-bladed beta-propeller [Gemmatimonadota bacterium]NIU51529.1 6-bladed beta-propeller [Gemmatimonadota bacterium]